MIMHPRNPYKTRLPDFTKLALEHDDLKQHCSLGPSGKIKLDFKNPAAIRALTITLLAVDFNLHVHIPLDCLVPRVPQRLNYLLWLEDLLLANNFDVNDVRGIDVGCGASCVYPLLAARQLNWSFLATERDKNASAVARTNVERNGFSAKIEVVNVDVESTALLPLLNEPSYAERSFAFCMCNPPFYDVDEVKQPCFGQESPEVVLLRDTKHADCRPEPHSATVAKHFEVAAEGGEVAFVAKIIEDSTILRDRIRIYTSMVGKKSSLVPLKQRLRAIDEIHDFTETTFVQGKTHRWALAWTFCSDVQLTQRRECSQEPIEFAVSTGDSIMSRIIAILDDLNLAYRFVSSSSIEAVAFDNTWTNVRRRKRDLQRLLTGENTTTGNGEPLMKSRKNSCQSVATCAPRTPFSWWSVDGEDDKIQNEVNVNGNGFHRDSILTTEECASSNSKTCQTENNVRACESQPVICFTVSIRNYNTVSMKPQSGARNDLNGLTIYLKRLLNQK